MSNRCDIGMKSELTEALFNSELRKILSSGDFSFEPKIEITEQHIDENGNNVIDRCELKSISFVRKKKDD